MHIENVDDNIVDNIYLHQQQQQQQLQQEYSMKSMDNFVKNKEKNDDSMFDDDDDNVKLSNDNVGDNVVDNNNNSAKENQNLIPCTLCQRKFLSDRLEKHLIICQKIKEKKRKLFDAAKQRAENLDKINLVPTEITINEPVLKSTNKNLIKTKKTIKSDKNDSSTTKQSNWRQQHQEFIRTIRAARGVSIDDNNIDDGDGDGNGDNPMDNQKTIPAGFTECPTCQRRFSIKAADRHIEWCAESKRKQQDRQQNLQKNQEALERMKARTKYKPNVSSTNNNGKSLLSRSKSITTLSSTGSTISSTSSVTSTSTTIRSKSKDKPSKSTKTNENSSTINHHRRNNTRIISKSSDNLPAAVKMAKTTATTTMNNSKIHTNKSPSLSRRTTTTNTPNNSSKNNQKFIKKTTTGNINGHVTKLTVTSKIDTGINPDRNPSRNRNHEKSAPIMKFKEKFPNHHLNNHAKSIIDQFQDIEHILRRNSMAIYDDSPKTVPGVRIGGISPVKKSTNKTNNRNDNDNNRNILSRSETNLQQMLVEGGGGGGDIKKRIDQYINRLYDNPIWSTANNNGLVNRISDNDMVGNMMIGQQPPLPLQTHHNNGRITELSNHDHHQQSDSIIRQNSANSDEARMSTSDSTDSGLGVIVGGFGLNGCTNQLLETVNECDNINRLKSQQSNRSGSKTSNRTFRADMINSPTMSDIEPINNNHLLLRNSSLNEIELNDNSILIDNHHHQQKQQIIDHEIRPRFCHQCGTKYPNVMAKFCYECGSRRYETMT